MKLKRPKLHLKQGDKIVVFCDQPKKATTIHETTVVGFTAVGMQVSRLGIVPFSAGLFYGFGYHNDMRFIVVKEEWHYTYATWFEWLRLALPEKVSIWIFGD
jgi:hypothetical protein